MATYISTVAFTDEGVENLKETCKRAKSFKTRAKKMGVKVLNSFWTLGQFDGLILFEAPDDESATAAMMDLCSQGFIRTNTSRAFKISEMDKVLAKLGK